MPSAEQRRLDLLIPGIISISAIAVGAIVILSKSSINRPVALACALGFLSVGVLMGFLFGIPKVFQGQGEAATSEAANGSKPEERGPSYRMQVNTNLEQISDWLTKIIVGVGLVELKQIPDSLLRLAAFIQPGLGSGEEARVMALAIILYASLLGFFLGYLVTRTYIAGIFRRADEQLVAQVEVDGVSISINEAERLQRTIIEDLQEHVARLENALNGPPPGTADADPPVESAATTSAGDAPESDDPETDAPNRPEPRAPHMPRRILWVDDQPENNRYHLAFLRRRGVVVVTAQSTAEALTLLRREPFDVVLSDTNRTEGGRPNPNAAVDLARALKEQLPHLPLYVYTKPTTPPAIEEKARAAGAAAVFRSPTDLLRALHIDCP